jgi:hypothetical protein
LENKRVNKIEIHTVFKQIEDKIKTDISLLIKAYIQIQYYEKVNYYFPFRQLFFWNYDWEIKHVYVSLDLWFANG